MKLKPVSHYSGARYPRLADYLAKSTRGRTLSTVGLAIALAALLSLLAGCGNMNGSVA